MLTNYHTHTYRCKHAHGSEEDYIKEAILNKFNILGMSDHGPFSDDRDIRMSYKEFPDYLNILSILKEKYKDQIQILAGFEIEYDPNESKYYESLLDRKDLDYLILGQHFFYDKYNNFCNSFALPDTETYLAYASTAMEGMKTGYFKFLAHPDLMFYSFNNWDKNCDIACDIIITESIKHNYILEFNSNGIRYGQKIYPDGKRYSYPHKKFWDLVKETQLQVIVNSDCHEVKKLNDACFQKAKELAKEWGLNVIECI